MAQNISRDDLELLVINDCSVDNSVGIVNEFAEKYSNIRILETGYSVSQGLSFVRDFGIQNSTGDYLFFLDADDYIAYHSLEEIFKILESLNHRDKSIDVVFFNIIRTKVENFFDMSNREISNKISSGIDYFISNDVNNNACQYLANKKFLLKIKYFLKKKIFFEDGMFTLDVMINVKSVYSSGVDCYKYVQRKNSITSSSDILHQRNLIKDYNYVIMFFYEKMKLNYCEEFTDKVKNRMNSYIMFMQIRMIRCGFDSEEAKKC